MVMATGAVTAAAIEAGWSINPAPAPARSSGLLRTGGAARNRLCRLLRGFFRGFLDGALAAAADRQQHFALALDALLRLLALRLLLHLAVGGGRLLFAGKAALERIHQVDDIAGALRCGLGRGAEAVAFLVDQGDQGLFVAVFEL